MHVSFVYYFCFLSVAMPLSLSIHDVFRKTMNSPFPLTNDTIEERMKMEETSERKPVTEKEIIDFDIQHDLIQGLFFTAPYPITLSSELLKDGKVAINDKGYRVIDILENYAIAQRCQKGEQPSDRDIDQIVHKNEKVVYKRYKFECGPPSEITCPSWIYENSMSDIKMFENLFVMRDDGKAAKVKEIRSISDCILQSDDEPMYLTRTDRLNLLGLTWDTYLDLDMEIRRKIFKISDNMYREMKEGQRILTMAGRENGL